MWRRQKEGRKEERKEEKEERGKKEILEHIIMIFCTDSQSVVHRGLGVLKILPGVHNIMITMALFRSTVSLSTSIYSYLRVNYNFP